MGNPYLELKNSSGQLIASNDRWLETQGQAIYNTGLDPSSDGEAAILSTLATHGAVALKNANDFTRANAASMPSKWQRAHRLCAKASLHRSPCSRAIETIAPADKRS